MWTDLVAAGAMIAGTFFVWVAAVGVWRLGGFYMRVHAPTKAATLGLAFLLVAVAVALGERTVVTKALLTMLFIGATAPVGAHLLARAAYRSGVASNQPAVPDEYADVVARRKAALGRTGRAPDLDA